jgi:hypothetical protein
MNPFTVVFRHVDGNILCYDSFAEILFKIMPLLLVVGTRNKVVCSRHIVLETKEICAESEKSKRPQSIWLAA